MVSRKLVIKPLEGKKHLALYDQESGETIAGCIDLQLINEVGKPLKATATFVIDGERVGLQYGSIEQIDTSDTFLLKQGEKVISQKCQCPGCKISRSGHGYQPCHISVGKNDCKGPPKKP